MLNTVKVPEGFESLFLIAQDYVRRYFEDKHFDPTQGTIEIFWERYIMMRAASMSVEFFDTIMSLYRDKGEEGSLAVAGSLLFDIAHAIGYSDAKNFEQRMNVTDPIAKLSAGPIHFAHAGWAFVDIFPESRPSPDENFYLIYDHPYSFESDSWMRAGKKSKFPVCFMNAGYSSGWCEESFGVTLVASEIMCRAKGDDHCRFIMAAPCKIEEYIQAYLKSRTDIAHRVTHYDVPGFFSRKKIEEDLHRTLEMKEEYFRSLIENSSDIITLLDNRGTFVYSTPSVEHILGYKQDELIGKIAFDYIHPEDRQRIIEVFTRLVLKPGTQPREEFRFLHKDGSWRIIESIGYNLLDNPAVRGVIINTRDITEKKILQAEIMRSGQLASIGELAAGVAHEVNNPIMGIINYAQILVNKNESGMTFDIANRIIKEGNRIAGIVSNLLSLSSQEKEEKAVVPIHEILADSLELAERQLQKDGIKLKVDVSPKLPEVIVNPQQIQQVFLNIISNARYALNLKYPQHHQNKILDISAGEVSLDGHRHVKVTFHDRGIGIPEHIKDKIMEPFFTTKPRGVGTGLGLSISYGIIKDHGGEIMIDSAAGEFTKAAVLLPLKNNQSRHFD